MLMGMIKVNKNTSYKGCENMGVLTENMLRSILKNQNISEYIVEKGVIVTPSAKQYLQDKKIKLIYEENMKTTDNKKDVKNVETKEKRFIPRYEHINGGFFENKPEHMTQLNGNKLVTKDHKRIILRGKLDSLQAKILKAEILCKNLKEEKVLKDLEEILDYVRKILACEVTEESLPQINLLGLNEKELRAYSHNPKKYLNTEHIIFPSYEMGDIVVELNSLRANTREVEIVAFTAFKSEDGEPLRKDIAQAMNRLSSCFYVMMCKYVSGKYK
ncbi:cobalamin adenosyltransferase [Clostridium tetani]|uniref:Cobalamin adenosyltransferase n=3 Tax=Clostridium tetani TaxID=1513 RepID=A0ABY0EP79_CLOTA|nr:cobalamin adenosyltransferase [Clostridium tetani]RXI55951.1 cobalamin adenosyltransferase [Clostridium tetani]RXI66076.1 cobalamin adenosyltransferase [Clostridium tetani]